MRTSEIKKIVKRYADKLKKENFPFVSIYLFGSFAKNMSHQESDIDIAVISDRLKNYNDKYFLQLWNLRRDIDLRIEPHGFTPKEFDDINDPMVYEIRTTGLKIA